MNWYHCSSTFNFPSPVSSVTLFADEEEHIWGMLAELMVQLCLKGEGRELCLSKSHPRCADWVQRTMRKQSQPKIKKKRKNGSLGWKKGHFSEEIRHREWLKLSLLIERQIRRKSGLVVNMSLAAITSTTKIIQLF
jgi:hypothetical protein